MKDMKTFFMDKIFITFLCVFPTVWTIFWQSSFSSRWQVIATGWCDNAHTYWSSRTLHFISQNIKSNFHYNNCNFSMKLQVAYGFFWAYCITMQSKASTTRMFSSFANTFIIIFYQCTTRYIPRKRSKTSAPIIFWLHGLINRVFLLNIFVSIFENIVLHLELAKPLPNLI